MYRLAAFIAAAAVAVGLAGPALAASAPGVPGLTFTVTKISEKTPVFITEHSRHESRQGAPGANFIQCLDFRVLSRKTVSAVRFTMRFQDEFGNSHFTWDLDRRGSFAPGEVVHGTFDDSRTYENDQSVSCWVVPVNRFDTGMANITKLVLETTQVAFSDGSVWRTGQHFDQAFLPNGDRFTAAAAAAPSPPPIRVSTRWATAGHAPIEGLDASTGYYLGSPRQCVSFRNVANQVATNVDFDLFYADAAGARLVAQSMSHAGTFTPPVEIDEKCGPLNLGSADQIRRLAHAVIHVRRVVFNDGTEWREGQSFTRAWGNNGDRITPVAVAAAPVLAASPAGTAQPTVAVFGVNGAPPPGVRYGSIAISAPGNIAAVATDAETPGRAMADAIDECNKNAGGNTCSTQLQFSADRCGAVAMRRLENVEVAFFGTAATKRDAEANALVKAGTGARILASGCNTR